ncbi:hypothetical protein E3U26_03180 [Paracoccus ferrooxidans]|nr:hypothetical protein E3U26_03180 [Paracoccus ferrooxidans]
MISDDPNHDAGLSAVSNAQAGNWALLRARLCDPAITLTMFEREWLARERLPGKSGRPKEAQEPLLYWWFRQALLHNSGDGRGYPLPGQTYPTASVTGMPSAV